jgi:hypothetical protein
MHDAPRSAIWLQVSRQRSLPDDCADNSGPAPCPSSYPADLPHCAPDKLQLLATSAGSLSVGFCVGNSCHLRSGSRVIAFAGLHRSG